MIYLLMGILWLTWFYVLRVLKKSELTFWHFLWGSAGIFILMMLYLRPAATQPLAKMVAAVAGIPGELFGIYTAYFKYGVIFVKSGTESMFLLIDFECSGILEIMAFISLLLFFDVYSKLEKMIVGVIGAGVLFIGNALRIMLICGIIHFTGVASYYVAHAFIGRIVFYMISVVVYFYVFTKPQIVRQKIGGFHYESHS